MKKIGRKALRVLVTMCLLLSLAVTSASAAAGSLIPRTGSPEQTTTTTKKSTTTTTTQASNGKVIYLTFDDGPGQYTEQLLDVLKKHNVKATFFVTNQFPKYQKLIAREAEEGHAVAVHTYSHKYSQIYKSTDAYWSDFNKMNKIIKEQTGEKTTLFRFPGGSSNTVSKSYSKGIMTKLVKQANNKGYAYFDWNVDSKDADGANTANKVCRNIKDGVKDRKNSIVLCHDVKSWTVEAMDKTITWALKNGYTFKVLTNGGYTVHHSINN